MCTDAKGQVPVWFTIKIYLVRILKLIRVTIRRRPQHVNPFASADCLATYFGVRHHVARKGMHRRFEAQEFIDGYCKAASPDKIIQE